MAVSIGIEVGPSSVRAVQLAQQPSRLRLVASAEARWSGENAEELTKAIGQVRAALSIRQPVVVGFSTTSAIVTTVHPLVVNTERSALAVRFELQQSLPYEIDQAVWHHQWLSANGRSQIGHQASALHQVLANGPKAVVAAMKRSLVEERLRACQRAGVAVQAAGVTALAAVNLWWHREGATTPHRAVLLHLDESVLEWIILNEQGLFVVPMFLPPEVAAQDQESIGSVPESLVSHVKASWMSIHQQAEIQTESLPNMVWLLGASATRPHVTEELTRALGCSVNILVPERMAEGSRDRPSTLERFGIAYGLALQGLGLSRFPLNLIGNIQRHRRLIRVRRTAQFLSFLSGLFAAGFSVYGMFTILATRHAVLRRVTEQEATYQKLRPEVRASREQQARVETRVRQLEQIVQAHGRIGQAFHQVVTALPETVWLTKVDIVKGQHLEAVFDGHAKSFQDVTELMGRLKSTAWTTVKPLATNVTTDPATGKELITFTVKVQETLPGSVLEEAVSQATPVEETSKGRPAQQRPPASPKRNGSTR